MQANLSFKGNICKSNKWNRLNNKGHCFFRAFSVTGTVPLSPHSFPHLILYDCMSRTIILHYKAGLENFNNLPKSCALPVEGHNSNVGSLTPEPKSLGTKSWSALVRTDTDWGITHLMATWNFSSILWAQKTHSSTQSDSKQGLNCIVCNQIFKACHFVSLELLKNFIKSFFSQL